MSWRYFTLNEMACKCGKCETKMDEEFMFNLEQLREHADFPFVITSAYRCAKHNKDIGGYPKSKHLTGQAVDILCYGDNAHKLLSLARRYKMYGIGVSQKGDFGKRFVHVDQRENPTIWSY